VAGVTAAIREGCEESTRICRDGYRDDAGTGGCFGGAGAGFGRFCWHCFAGLALLLAATGIFGVISYSVSCRTNEIGIRVALGASSESILGGVFRETLKLALVGLAIGLPCALAASRLIGHFAVRRFCL